MLNKYHNKNPKIGVFDSGIGGLTVAHAINNVLPHQDLLYIGDTAHCPWGNKSRSQIISYSNKLIKFLIENNCKVIVVACNTASAVALKYISTEFKDIQLFNVIDPTIMFLKTLNLSNFKNMGIIGTKQTIHSQAYQDKIKSISSIEIKSLATPLLVPLIEEGWLNNQVMGAVIEQYLSQLNLTDLSILILGCTHYPLIKQQITAYYAKINKRVMVIDSASIVAAEVQGFLSRENNNNKVGNREFYCTDNSEFFLEIAKRFFGNITIDLLPLWKEIGENHEC